jgi:hypothetical protein
MGRDCSWPLLIYDAIRRFLKHFRTLVEETSLSRQLPGANYWWLLATVSIYNRFVLGKVAAEKNSNWLICVQPAVRNLCLTGIGNLNVELWKAPKCFDLVSSFYGSRSLPRPSAQSCLSLPFPWPLAMKDKLDRCDHGMFIAILLMALVVLDSLARELDLAVQKEALDSFFFN